MKAALIFSPKPGLIITLASFTLNLEAVVRRSSSKQILKNFTISQKKPVLESFFNKAAGLQACTLLKRDFNTDIFLRNLRNFKNIFFYKISKFLCTIFVFIKASQESSFTSTDFEEKIIVWIYLYKKMLAKSTSFGKCLQPPELYCIVLLLLCWMKNSHALLVC